MARQQQNQGRNWYVIHTYSGYEEAVVRNLKQRIESMNMKDKIFNVLVPKEKKIKIKNGQRKVIEEKIFPGYVLVDMIVDDASWYVVRNTPRVTGFIGSGTVPLPLPSDKVETLLSKMEQKEPEYKISFSPGELVKIVEGPFKDFDGKVIEVDASKGLVKIAVNMFGRETPVELDTLQVKKV